MSLSVLQKKRSIDVPQHLISQHLNRFVATTTSSHDIPQHLVERHAKRIRLQVKEEDKRSSSESSVEPIIESNVEASGEPSVEPSVEPSGEQELSNSNEFTCTLEPRSIVFNKKERAKKPNQLLIREDSIRVMLSFDPSSLVIFADGSCPGGKGFLPTGSGVVFLLPFGNHNSDRMTRLSNMTSTEMSRAASHSIIHSTGVIHGISTHHPKGSNNSSEVLAIFITLLLLERAVDLQDAGMEKNVVEAKVEVKLEAKVETKVVTKVVTKMENKIVGSKVEKGKEEKKAENKIVGTKVEKGKEEKKVEKKEEKKAENKIVGTEVEKKEEKTNVISNANLSGNLEIITDSEWTANAISGEFKNITCHLKAIHHIQEMIRRRLQRFPGSRVRLHNMYGHVGIHGNTFADALAKRAIGMIPSELSRAAQAIM